MWGHCPGFLLGMDGRMEEAPARPDPLGGLGHAPRESLRNPTCFIGINGNGFIG